MIEKASRELGLSRGDMETILNGKRWDGTDDVEPWSTIEFVPRWEDTQVLVMADGRQNVGQSANDRNGSRSPGR
jgi:hypothetical protein